MNCKLEKIDITNAVLFYFYLKIRYQPCHLIAINKLTGVSYSFPKNRTAFVLYNKKEIQKT